MVLDLFQQAAEALRHDRRRAALTMLGMAWGIATVVLLLAYGGGLEHAADMVFNSFGDNAIGVFPGRTSMQAGGIRAGTPVRFNKEDLQYLVEEIPLIKRISPVSFLQGKAQRDNRAFDLQIRGVYPAFLEIRKMQVVMGRSLTEQDLIDHARVAVIGDDARQKLFSSQPPLGETIRLLGITYTVVGVINHKVQPGEQNDNSFVMTPYTSFGTLTDTTHPGGIWLNYEGPFAQAVERQVRLSLSQHHNFRFEDRRAIFVANSVNDLAELWMLITGIRVLLAIIGALTLGIGGVSLMNIMLVAVSQRTREIGVEKALGARRRHILVQFLAEALVITFAGGVLGVLLAYAVSFSVGSLTLFSAFIRNAQEADIHLSIRLSTLGIASAILVVVGVVSGMLPAIKAARLDPIEALRYE